MPHKVSIGGKAAELRWGYHRAATVGDWTLAAQPTASQLTGTITEADTFRVTQRPLTFVVTRSAGPPWIWPVDTLQIVDGRLTATLGPQEGA